MVSSVVLAYQVCPDTVLLLSGSCLTQSQVADLMICPGRFESPFAETPLHLSCLDFLLEEVDLSAQHLALFVHGSVSINFSHKTPIVAGELVEGTPDCGEGGPASHQSG